MIIFVYNFKINPKEKGFLGGKRDHVTSGILIPQPGTEPVPSIVEAWSLLFSISAIPFSISFASSPVIYIYSGEVGRVKILANLVVRCSDILL